MLPRRDPFMESIMYPWSTTSHHVPMPFTATNPGGFNPTLSTAPASGPASMMHSLQPSQSYNTATFGQTSIFGQPSMSPSAYQFQTSTYAPPPAGIAGASIVKDVVTKIGKSGVFADDKGLMRRIAYVESKDGTDRNTKRPGYYGGVFQVDKKGFDDTQNVKSHPALAKKYDKIQKEFGIHWPSVKWEDIRDDPLKSGLAARLFLSNKPEAIPSDVNGQAEYWKKHYNTPAGAGTAEKFKNDVGHIPK